MSLYYPAAKNTGEKNWAQLQALTHSFCSRLMSGYWMSVSFGVLLVQLCGWLELCGSARSHLLHSLPACCSPRMPAAVLVFIAVGSARAAEDESSFPAASVSQPLPRSGAAEHNALPHPTFLPVQGWNSTAGRESGWIPNELFLASIWFPFLLMIWKMQTMLWKGGTVLQAGSVRFPSFISCNNNLESLFIKAVRPYIWLQRMPRKEACIKRVFVGCYSHPST